MRHFLIAVAFTFMTAFTAHAQDKITKHTVEKGETVTQIAQAFKVTPADIYRLNPDAQNGLKPGMVILIQGGKAAKTADAPKSAEASKAAKAQQVHLVAAGETAYGIAKKFEVSVADLEKANPAMKNGLKAGDTIYIPSAKAQANAPANTMQTKEKEPKPEKEGKSDKDKKKGKETVYHTVEAKETKYSIARQYGISVEELEAANPEVKGGLQIGYRLKIVEDAKIRPQSVEVREDKSVVVKTEPKKPEFQEYTVKPKETLYGLSKRFEVSQEELVKLNPDLKDGVREGSVLKLPMNVQFSNNTRESSGLAKTVKTSEKKNLAILLPFNLSKIQVDTTNSITSRLKTDKFLNMTLDFYSGALMAIDSAKTMGLNVDVRILDSQETKNASAIATLIQQNDLTHMDAVIGPFYQANVEKTAELLSKSNVPVISPLSKETGKLYPNLLQSMTQEDYMKDAMYGYMDSKGANIIAIVDPKKLSVKKYLAENQKAVQIASFVNGILSADGLKALLQKGVQNYIVLETENTMMIKTTINTLLAALPDYQVQLVITGQNDTLDYEEIQVANLAKLKLMYPSLIRDNDTPEALIFEKNYKEKNKVFPNRYATRGFDVTFDTLLRLSQEKSFAETLETVATEQVDNKFDYEKKSSGAFVNTGFYILYYDTDLSVKQVNN